MFLLYCYTYLIIINYLHCYLYAAYLEVLALSVRPYSVVVSVITRRSRIIGAGSKPGYVYTI